MTGGLHFLVCCNGRDQGLMFAKTFSHTVTERFLRYVTIDTQSAHNPTSYPVDREAEGPRPAARAGAARARHRRRASRSTYGYVYATVPSNTDKTGPGDLLLRPHGHLAGLHRQGREAADRAQLPGRRHRAARRSQPGRSASPTIRRSRTRSATTSSRATARPCSAPTTRPASPRSWMR